MSDAHKEAPPSAATEEGREERHRHGKHSTPPRRIQALPAIGAIVCSRTLGAVLRDLDRATGHARAALLGLAQARSLEERAAAAERLDLARAHLNGLLRAGCGSIVSSRIAEGA